ncbi:MAG: FecCD family ABC transporter permease [Lentisphaeria bacterium]
MTRGKDDISRSKRRYIGGFICLFIVTALICPFLGSHIPSGSAIVESLAGNITADGEIFLMHRVPRVILGLIAGGTLAVTGAVFQVILRNPLAEPFTLGTTGGATLGAIIAISFPALWISWGPFSSVQLFALAGAGGTLFIIYLLANKRTGLSMHTLLLAGVTLSIFCASLVLLLRYLMNPDLLVQMDRWMMGGLEIVGYRELASLLPFLLPGLGLMFYIALPLNHLSVSEELARGHGIQVEAVQKISFIAGGLATSAVVSLTGPISFVGLIIPHIVRRLTGYDQRLVLPLSFLLGGVVLTLCDAATRTLAAPSEMPVGIVTALIGCPVFLWILCKKPG